MTMRTGIGYDSHRLVKGRKLVLGGVEIPYGYGLLGHSDADALAHAVCDAVFGALGKGDIGEHFPDTDPSYAGISSMTLVARAAELMRQEGFQIANVDAVVLAQEPNLKGFKEAMAEALAQALGIGVSRVNIKAKTNEGLGFAGRREGIACWATVLLVSAGE